MPDSQVVQGRLLALAGACLWSLGGLGIKMCSFGPWQTSCVRAGCAAVMLFVLFREARQRWTWQVSAVGLALGLNGLLFVWGNKTTTAANTIFIQSAYPLWVLLLAPFWLKETVRFRDVGWAAVFAAGLTCCVLSPEKATLLSPEIAKGNTIALCSTVAFALSVMGLRALRGRGALAALTCGNVYLCLGCLPMMLIGGWGNPDGFLLGTVQDWLVVAFLGCVQYGLGNALFALGLRTIPAVQASLLGLIEPVLNPLWVYLVFSAERPGPLALIGGGVIVVATACQLLRRN